MPFQAAELAGAVGLYTPHRGPLSSHPASSAFVENGTGTADELQDLIRAEQTG
jgi:hypothetical protein